MKRQHAMPRSDVQSILNALPEAVFCVNNAGQVSYWNETAAELFQWQSQKPSSGPPVDDTFHVATDADGSHDHAEWWKHPGVISLLVHGEPGEFAVVADVAMLEGKGEAVVTARPGHLGAEVSDEPVTQLLAQGTSRWAGTASLESAMQVCVRAVCEASLASAARYWATTPDQTRLQSDEILFCDGRQIRLDAAVEIGPTEGIVGKAWTVLQPQWHEAIPKDPSLKGFADSDRKSLRSSLAYPVVANGEFLGIVQFFSEVASPGHRFFFAIGRVGEQLVHGIERRTWDAERARSAAIIDSTSDAVVARGLDGKILEWNSGAERIYGYSASEMLGQQIDVIVPSPLEEEEPELAEAMRLGRRLEQLETVRRRKDGELIDVAITASPLRNSADQLIGVATISRDVTSTKRRESDLRRALDAAQVAKRTQQQFLANVSHELRTPMNAIIGMLELSLGEELPDRVHDYLETARDSSQIMLSLVDDLLDYSRMEAGRFELEMDPFSVRRVLDSAMRSLSLRAFEHGLELLYEVDSNVPDRLIGDARRLRQVITNLAGNAIKFTEEGEVSVRLSMESRELEHVTLKLTVNDTGIGIAAADQTRIFDAFTQVDASSTRRHSGAGLGLTISGEIIRQMGGSLSLKSEVGQGTTFTVLVRFRVLSRRADNAAETVQQLDSLPVLVVDDNATNRRILAETLTNWSMRPITVPDGSAALTLIEKARSAGQPIPLLIVDGAMPEMDGCTLVRRMEDRGLIEGAHVLMLSSGGSHSSLERLDLPITAFLEKPVSQSMLLDAIMTALNGPPKKRQDIVQIRRTTQPLNVLVAEDTPANRKVVDAILERRGHRRDLVANGRQALEKCRTNNYDAILMDVQMPVMDGLQATAAIRALPSGGDVPIIAMTAHAMRGDRERCLQAGMNAYVPKPIVANDLLQVLEQTALRARLHRKDRTLDAPATQPSSQVMSHSQESLAGVLNLALARQRLGNDETLLRDLATFFLEDAPALLTAFQTCVEQGNFGEATRNAHSLKGLAANFDANAAVKTAQLAENASRDRQADQLSQLVPDLIRETERAMAAIKQELFS